jgi:bacillopeptidase F
MLLLTLALGGLLLAPALAGDKEDDLAVDVTRVSCGLQSVMYDWDFNVSSHGFAATTCGGGLSVWAWGAESTIPDSPGNLWATVLNGNYPNLAGDSLMSPTFTVTPDAYLLEILNYVHIESNYDGGNLKVNGQIIAPIGGYTHTMNTSPICVASQAGFSGNGYQGPSQVWLTQCFDLSAYMGQDVELQFDFGSDSSVMYPGWYLAYVKIGTDTVIANEDNTWTQIKGIFR